VTIASLLRIFPAPNAVRVDGTRTVYVNGELLGRLPWPECHTGACGRCRYCKGY